MATYELTPNIGLKNIDIGSFPWGAEERENKTILDSALASINSNGKLKVVLRPENAILQDPKVTQINLDNQHVLSFPSSVDATALWFITGAETYEYSPQRIPFVATGTWSGDTAQNVLTGVSDDVLNELQVGDAVTIDGNDYTVQNLVAHTLMVTPELKTTVTATTIGVQPVVSYDRITVRVYWTCSSDGQPNFSVAMKTVNNEDVIINDMTNNHVFPSLGSATHGKLNISQVMFSPSPEEIVAGKPMLFRLDRITDTLADYVSVLGVDISLSRAKCVPAFYNTYYNVTSTGEIEPQQVTYLYDANGNISQSIELIYGETRTTNFIYDTNGNIIQQIVEYQGVRTTDTYTYDANSNISFIQSISSLI